MKMSIVLSMAFCAVCSAFSENITYNGEGRKAGAAEPSALTNAINWSDSSMPTDGDYLLAISSSKYVGWDGSDFKCNSLTLGSSGADSGAGALELCSSNVTYHFYNLISRNGLLHTYFSSGTATLSGNIQISNECKLDFRTHGKYKEENVIAATIVGGGTFAYYKVSNIKSDYAPLTVSGDLSGYTGVFSIGDSSDNPRAYFKDTTCAGTIRICKGAGLYVQNAASETHYGCLTTAGLELFDDSKVYFGFNAATSATFNVRQALSLPDAGNVTFHYSGYALPTTHNTSRIRHPIVVAPTGQIDLGKIKLANVDDVLLAAGAVHWELEEDERGDGYDVLYLVQEKYRYQTKSDGWSECALTTTFGHWSGEPSGIEDGMVYIDKDKTLQMANCSFANRLCIGGGTASFCSHHGCVFTASDLICFSPMAFVMNQAGAQINGKITVCGTGFVSVKAGKNQTDTIGADISGAGGLEFTCNCNDSDCQGAINLTGDNRNFTGKIKIACESATLGTNVQVNVSTSANLGGDSVEFAFDGLTIGQGGFLNVDGGVEVGVNRGLYCSVDPDNPIGGINVAGKKAFAVKSRLTMNGILRKMGAGLLVLGGSKPKFSSDERDVPEEGLNKLEVMEGGLKISSAEAVNGLEVVLPEDGKLTLDADADDGDLKTRGVVNTAWVKPFDLTACGGKLVVDVNGIMPGKRAEFAICTVSREAVTTLDGNIILPEVRQLKSNVLKIENADGSVTFKARYDVPGLMLIFR